MFEDTTVPVLEQPTRLQQVADALTYVFDPEFDVDIVNLGLVYDIDFDEHDTLVISMTLTTPACPLTDSIERSIADILDGIVEGLRVDWVWTPPWTPDRVSDEGRDMLRACGISI